MLRPRLLFEDENDDEHDSCEPFFQRVWQPKTLWDSAYWSCRETPKIAPKR
jgi:hypothetical protein